MTPPKDNAEPQWRVSLKDLTDIVQTGVPGDWLQTDVARDALTARTYIATLKETFAGLRKENKSLAFNHEAAVTTLQARVRELEGALQSNDNRTLANQRTYNALREAVKELVKRQEDILSGMDNYQKENRKPHSARHIHEYAIGQLRRLLPTPADSIQPTEQADDECICVINPEPNPMCPMCTIPPRPTTQPQTPLRGREALPLVGQRVYVDEQGKPYHFTGYSMADGGIIVGGECWSPLTEGPLMELWEWFVGTLPLAKVVPGDVDLKSLPAPGLYVATECEACRGHGKTRVPNEDLVDGDKFWKPCPACHDGLTLKREEDHGEHSDTTV